MKKELVVPIVIAVACTVIVTGAGIGISRLLNKKNSEAIPVSQQEMAAPAPEAGAAAPGEAETPTQDSLTVSDVLDLYPRQMSYEYTDNAKVRERMGENFLRDVANLGRMEVEGIYTTPPQGASADDYAAYLNKLHEIVSESCVITDIGEPEEAGEVAETEASEETAGEPGEEEGEETEEAEEIPEKKSGRYYADALYEAVYAGGAQMACRFVTDTNNVWYDGGDLFVRGVLILETKGIEKPELIQDLLPVRANPDSTYYIVMDIGISSETGKVTQIYGVCIL